MKDMKVTDKRCLDLSLIVLEGIPGIKFDMRAFRFRRECGTAGCIGGYAVATYDPQLWESSEAADSRIEVRAARLLGLGYIQAGEMFYPWLSASLRRSKEYAPTAKDITPEMAAEMLTHFVRTKKVVWRRR